MKVVLLSPWLNAWVPLYRAAYEARGHEFMHCKTDLAPHADIYLHAWATGDTTPRYGSKNYVFMRRYELFAGGLRKVKWKAMDGLVVVNSWIKGVVEEAFKHNGVTTPVHLIYNGTDLSRWRFKLRRPGNRVAMACHIHPKKNLPLALQILAALPEDYQLHIAGEVQDACTAEYLNDVAIKMRRSLILYGHIEHSDLSRWWDDMDYCLSTSISEGNPNNVIEAAAKGIKPVVHSWPGAEDQFAPYTFNTVAEAVAQITAPEYDSNEYRGMVLDKFSLANIERVVDLTLGESHEGAARDGSGSAVDGAAGAQSEQACA